MIDFIVICARPDWGAFRREFVDAIFDTRRAAEAYIAGLAPVEGRTFRIEEWAT